MDAKDNSKKPLKGYLFGTPIHHSLAPLIHGTVFQNLGLPWTFELIDSHDKADFLPRLKASDCIGASVTMPHKISCMEDCDEITETGRAVGAINTIYKKQDEVTGKGKLIGTNTDCIGVRESFLQGSPGILEKSTGQPALVIGAGGACRSAIFALAKWLGASHIYLVNRLQSEADDVINSFAGLLGDVKVTYIDSPEKAKAMETPVLVVGTVPDFPPTSEGEIIARDIVQEFLKRSRKGYVLEMCYHPLVTSFYKLCEDNGWEVIPGTQPLIHQAMEQEMIWTEKSLREMPLGAVQAAVLEEVRRRETQP